MRQGDGGICLQVRGRLQLGICTLLPCVNSNRWGITFFVDVDDHTTVCKAKCAAKAESEQSPVTVESSTSKALCYVNVFTTTPQPLTYVCVCEDNSSKTSSSAVSSRYNRLMQHVFCALAAALLLRPSVALPQYAGFTLACEGWSIPGANFSSPQTTESLHALAATGATSVRVLVTAYVDGVSSPTVYDIAPPSPLATATTGDVAPLLDLATSLNLSIVLQPIVDVDWSRPEYQRLHDWTASGAIARNDIGGTFTDAQWTTFFDSYEAFILPWAAAATQAVERGSLVTFSVGDELDHAFAQELRFRKLITAVRRVFTGTLTAAANGRSISTIAWWDAVDVIGHNAFWPLGAAAPIGTPLPVETMTAAWAPTVQMLGQLSAAHGGRRILLTAAGAQSRPNCHMHPWGTGGARQGDGNDQGDVSAWPVAYDVECQARVYASLIDAFSPHADTWWAGVLFWRWSSDPTQGGPSDSDFCPHGKSAEAVFTNWTNRGVGGADGADTVIEALRHEMKITRVMADATTASRPAFSGYRGFVFGGPDEVRCNFAAIGMWPMRCLHLNGPR